MNIKESLYIFFEKGKIWAKLKNFNSDCFSLVPELGQESNINIRYPNPLETYKVAKKNHFTQQTKR